MICNGRIILAAGGADIQGPSLFVEGQRVQLKHLAVYGGWRGVSVRAPGSATLVGCVLEANYCGLFTGSKDQEGRSEAPCKCPATLEATLTYVHSSTGCAVCVFSGSSMQLIGCEVLHGKTATCPNMAVVGKGSSLVMRGGACAMNKGKGLFVQAGGHARLVKSALQRWNSSLPCMVADGEGSLIQLVHMMLDGDIHREDGGRIVFLEEGEPGYAD
ncbi:MAG: hypothetical protein WDW36_007121 [Sanguina aurantia]